MKFVALKKEKKKTMTKTAAAATTTDDCFFFILFQWKTEELLKKGWPFTVACALWMCFLWTIYDDIAFEFHSAVNVIWLCALLSGWTTYRMIHAMLLQYCLNMNHITAFQFNETIPKQLSFCVSILHKYLW